MRISRQFFGDFNYEINDKLTIFENGNKVIMGLFSGKKKYFR